MGQAKWKKDDPSYKPIGVEYVKINKDGRLSKRKADRMIYAAVEALINPFARLPEYRRYGE